MAVVVTSTTILRPSPSSPHPLLHRQVLLSIFDRAAFDLHVPTLYAFRAPMPTNDALIHGLADVLRDYPHLAGRMGADEKGRPCFFLNNAGVRVVEAQVDASLADKLPLEACCELSELHPPVEGVEELLQVQLNRYSCGGLVIGVTSHHRVADGHSMSGFLVAWAATVRGLDASPPSPYLDRTAVSVPRSPPRCEFNHQQLEFKREDSAAATSPGAFCTVENLVVHFTAKFISKLKANILRDVAASGGPSRCSTFECLLAHLWKKTTVARGLADEDFTQVRVAVNGRARMKPAVPMEFFGNLVLWAYPRLRAGELLRESHAHAIKTIHEAVVGVDDAYFRSFIDFGAVGEEQGGDAALVATAPETGNSLCPNLEVDSWLRFNFHELDFGTGGPCAFLPPNLPVEGLMIFVPSCKDSGSVDVFIALAQEHAREFRDICYSLD